MILLLDSCVLIWMSQAPENISPRARAAIDNPSNDLCLSHASVWEIHLKHLAGKLSLPQPPRVWLTEQMFIWHVQEMPIDLEALHGTSDLPSAHKDPFDRLLAAQASLHGATLVSPDRIFRRCHSKVLW